MDKKLKYMENTYLFKIESIVEKISSDERGNFLTFNQTIFHPQGGGQPTDIGVIITKGGLEIDINFVNFTEGEIRHYFNTEIEGLKSGDTVLLKIDKNIRIVNAKCHSAGHIIQGIIETQYNMKAIKGYHFPKGSYVEFVGQKPSDISSFITDVNEKIASFILQEHKIISKFITVDELKQMNKNIILPKSFSAHDDVRVVIIEGLNLAVPCGGTHVANTKEFKLIEITKIKSKKGNLRMSYNFA